MPKCNICGCRWYRQTEIDPEEPCPCSYCEDGGSTIWEVDKWKSTWTWLKWKLIRIRFWWWDE